MLILTGVGGSILSGLPLLLNHDHRVYNNRDVLAKSGVCRCLFLSERFVWVMERRRRKRRATAAWPDPGSIHYCFTKWCAAVQRERMRLHRSMTESQSICSLKDGAKTSYSSKKKEFIIKTCCVNAAFVSRVKVTHVFSWISSTLLLWHSK